MNSPPAAGLRFAEPISYIHDMSHENATDPVATIWPCRAELLKDKKGRPVPYVALNVQNTPIRAEKLPRPLDADDARMGVYHNGANCGRWVEITFGENCVGHGNDAFSQPPIVCGRDANNGDPLVNFEEDSFSGLKVYAVVADACQDNNYWCAAPPARCRFKLAVHRFVPCPNSVLRCTTVSTKLSCVYAVVLCALRCQRILAHIRIGRRCRNDLQHLDLSRDLVLEACGGSTDCINARRIDWRFVDSLPEVPHLALPQVPQFAWHCRANFPWCATPRCGNRSWRGGH